MATQSESMIAWMLAKLKQAGAEGIPINNLFDELRQLWSLDRQTVAAQWKALIQEEEVISVVHNAQLKETPLRKLSLEDLEDLDLARNKIRHKEHGFTSNIPQPLEEQGSKTTFRSTSPVVFLHTSPAHHGGSSTTTNVWLPPQYLSSPRESSNTPPPNSLTNPTSQQPVPPVKKRMGRPPKNTENEAPKQKPTPTGPKKRMGRPPKNRAAALTGSLNPQQESSLANDAPLPLSVTNTNSNTTSNTNLSGIAPETPSRGRMRVSSNTASLTGEGTPRIKLNLNTTTPAKDNTSAPQPQDVNERPIREAVFTSHEQMQHQQGGGGVYIDLPGTARPDANPGECCIAVFKSRSLKDPAWLPAHSDSWRLRFAEVSKKDKDDVARRNQRTKSGRVRSQSGRARTQSRSLGDAENHGEEDRSTVLAKTGDANKISEQGPESSQETAPALPRVSTPEPNSKLPSTPPGVEDSPGVVRLASPIIVSPNNTLKCNPATPAKPYIPFQTLDARRRRGAALLGFGSTSPNLTSPAPVRENGSSLLQQFKPVDSAASTALSQSQDPAALLRQTPPPPPHPRYTLPTQSNSMESLPAPESQSILSWPPSTQNQSQWSNQPSQRSSNTPTATSRATASVSPSASSGNMHASATLAGTPSHPDSQFATNHLAQPNTGIASANGSTRRPYLTNPLFEQPRPYSSPYASTSNAPTTPQASPAVHTQPATFTQPLFHANTPQQLARSNYQHKKTSNAELFYFGYSNGWRSDSKEPPPNEPARWYRLSPDTGQIQGVSAVPLNTLQAAQVPGSVHRVGLPHASPHQQHGQALPFPRVQALPPPPQQREHHSMQEQSSHHGRPQGEGHLSPAHDTTLEEALSRIADQIVQQHASPTEKLPEDPQQVSTASESVPANTSGALAPALSVEASADLQKPRRSRKRKLSTSELPDKDLDGPSEAKVPKQRNANTPRRKGPFIGPKAPTAEDRFSASLVAAEQVAVPDDQTRLPCAFENQAGNLILSKDLTTLDFVGVEQRPAELPLLVLPVADISENPITSARGSNPMQLRIKVKKSDGSRSRVVHSFVYGNSTTSHDTASVLREKIVVAMVAEEMKSVENYQRPAELEEKLSKPFQCTKCDARFKNSNGLEYHLKKSQTTCNPNFDASMHKERKGGCQGKQTRKPRTPRKPKVDKPIEVESEVSADDQSDNKSESGSTSEDSIVGWWEQTTGAKRQLQAPKKESTEKVYKAFNRESEVLQEIIDNIASMSEEVRDEIQLPVAMPIFPSAVRDLAFVTSQIQVGEEPTQSMCETMITALVGAHYGMFPGWKSLWMSCLGFWLKRHPSPKVLPKSAVCSKALDNLINRKKLVLKEFNFVDRKGRLLKTSLILDPYTPASGPRFEMLKNLVQESHPRVYVPSYLAPPQRVLDILQAMINRELVLPQPEVDSEEDDDEIDEEDFMIFDSNSPDSQGILMEEDESTEDEFRDEVYHDAGEEEHSETEQQGSRPSTSTEPGRRKSIDPQTRAKISASMSKYYSRVRAGEIMHSRAPNKPRDRRIPVLVQTTSDMWQSTPSFMPNPETGAWDIPNQALAGQRKSSIAKGVRYRNSNATRLPEPITFMQAMNGSWSVRPFGHGVNPIHCRPGRRTVGSTTFDAYLKKINAGHRPVIYPKKNMIFGPNPPAKKFLQKIASGTPVNLQLTISPKPSQQKRRRTRIENSSPESPMSPLKKQKRYAVEDDDEDSDFEVTTRVKFDRSSLLPDTRPKRRAKRKIVEVNEEEIEELAAPEPKKLAPGALRNPGLETIPPRFGFCPPIYEGPDIDTIDFPKKYFSVIWTEQKVVGVDPETRFECSWTVREVQTPEGQYQVQWDDSFAFTSLTIPYHDLKVDNNIPPEKAQQEQPEVIKRSNRSFQLNGQSSNYVSQKDKLGWTRSQIALPGDFYGIFDDPAEAARVFRTQVAEPNEQSRKRQRLAESVLDTTEENRLIVAVTIIRILTGGLDQCIDWVLVASIFQNYSMNFLEKFWKRIIAGKEEMMEDLGRSFQRHYPEAYAKGKVPEFNFDTLVDNDWNGLIDWVQNTIPTPFGHRSMYLPATKEVLEDYYNQVELGGEDDWRETYFGLFAPIYKRLHISAAEPSVVPISLRTASDKLELEKSWVRAVALTPDDHWDDQAKIAGREKLGSLGLRLVDPALRVLLDAKVLKHVAKDRATPGRSYEATEIFWASLRKHLKEDLFIEGITYKRWMDQQFRSGVTILAMDFMANEGTVMALTSMQAAGRIVIENVNVPRRKFGLTDGGYETKSIPRERFTFDMVIKPTPSYIFDDENQVLQKIMFTQPPNEDQEDEDGKIAAWYGISGKVILDLWKQIIMGVSQTLALRAGINIAGLVKVFAPTLEAWELRLLMDWGVEVGLFERLSPNVEGWMVARHIPNVATITSLQANTQNHPLPQSLPSGDVVNWPHTPPLVAGCIHGKEGLDSYRILVQEYVARRSQRC
ncbi:hypothetical protein BDZ45DRAFT_806766 [Acephala macrosclerotiorum]|nr:hypothetical protein BDZ45DRAFT_806766 [Acephala macrosclerotiorum]